MTPVLSDRPALNHVGARVYYAALFLCPPAFRREFSSEMAQDVDEALGEQTLEGRPQARVDLWSCILVDLATTVVVQWLRTGLPILIPCSIAGALAATAIASQILWHQPLVIPTTAADRDLMTLILLTGVVLVVVVSTILFTFWFSRPLLRRQRR